MNLITNIDSYLDCRVFMSKRTGNIALALPLYVSNLEKEFKAKNKNIFIYGEKLGYMIYHPDFGELFLNNKADKEFVDLGRFDD